MKVSGQAAKPRRLTIADTSHPYWIPSQINAEFSHEHTLLTEIGDLVWYDSSDSTIKPVSSIADQGTAVATQKYLVDRFAGVSNSKQLVTDTTSRNARIIVDGIFDFPCASATFAVGDYVTPNYANNALEDQKLVKTTNPQLAIGRVVKEYSSATTKVKVRITSRVFAGILTIVPGVSAVGVPLTSFREVDANGDVGAITANGGVLASDTTPILLGDANEAMAIQWASSNSDPLAVGLALPPDFDGTSDCYVDLYVQSAGTDDAPSFTVETSWDGGAKVSDTATGSASADKQVITATILAADVVDAPFSLTLGLTPGAHTTDAWTLYGVRLRYRRNAM